MDTTCQPSEPRTVPLFTFFLCIFILKCVGPNDKSRKNVNCSGDYHSRLSTIDDLCDQCEVGKEPAEGDKAQFGKIDEFFYKES